MKRFGPFEVEVESLGRGGVGQCRDDADKLWSVRAAPPGARLRVIPMGRGNARRVQLLRAPPEAALPPCPAFGSCGGCALQELPLEVQAAHRVALHVPAVGASPDVVIHPVRGAGIAYGYRNRVEWSFGAKRWLTDDEVVSGTAGHGRWVGFHAPGRFDRVVDVDDCPVAHPDLVIVLRAVRRVLAESQLPAWDARDHVGFWRHLGARRSWATGEVLVSVHTATHPEGEAEIERLFAGLPPVAGLTWHVFDGVADAALGPVVRVFGKDHIDEVLGGIRFQLGPRTFFQNTTPGAEVLLSVVREALGPARGRLVDLYCGAGALGLPLMAGHASLLGVDEVAGSIDDARRTAESAGLVGARFVAGKVEDVVAAGDLDGAAVVVDPPRVGLHPRAAASIATCQASVIVYVACHAASLGRDRAVFEGAGWRLTDLWPVDLFPQTTHLEVVGRFVRGVA